MLSICMEVSDNFSFYIDWLNTRNIKYPNAFDFHYFKQWIHEEKHIGEVPGYSLQFSGTDLIPADLEGG